MLRLIHCSFLLREGILSLCLSCFVPSICRSRESPFLPQSVQGLTYHQQSSLRYPQTTLSQPPHRALCRHMAAPPSPQRCVFRNPAATEMWAGGEENCTRERTDFEKGTEELPEPRNITSATQPSPQTPIHHKAKPSPSSSPSHPPKCSKNTFKVLFYF